MEVISILYNKLGKTNISVSKLCFGSLTLGPLQKNLSLDEGAEVLAYAISNGINFTDTAELYQTYPYIKKAMEITQKYDLVISSKTYSYTKEMAVKAVEDARKAIDRDYIDIFMLHEQESIHTLNGHAPALEYLFEAKQKGIIKAVGASMHHIEAVNGAILKELDVIHPIMNISGLGIVDGSINEMESAVKKASENNIGVFSMKPLGGGNLHKKASECLEYILKLPFIDSVAIGMQSIDEVNANLNFLNNGFFSEESLSLLKSKNRHLHIDDWCEGCGKCVNRCAQKALSIKNELASCDFGKCILCGYCSAVCPVFAIKVV